MQGFFVIAPGFEPGTYSLEVSCSIQLSYATYFIFVGVAGFEPAASCSQSRRDNRATLHPEDKKSGETGTRTLATVTRRQISNLLRYHSGTSPIIVVRTYLFCGCKCMFSFVNIQLLLDFFYLFSNKNFKSAYIQHNNIIQKTYNLYHFLKTKTPF